MVLVTGHYDSRNTDNVMNTHDPAPGANDDASGVAVSLESARVLSKLKFPATIVFVAVAGEEQGLNGSRHLAKLAKIRRLAARSRPQQRHRRRRHHARRHRCQDKTAVRVFSEGVPATATPDQTPRASTPSAPKTTRPPASSPAPSSTSPHLLPPTSSTRPSPRQPAQQPHAHDPAFHPVLIFRRDRFLRGGDHTSFNHEGFAAVRFTEWRENFNHQHQNVRVENGIQYGDLLQFVDFNYVANVARLNAATLATLASAPGEPAERPRPHHRPRQQHQAHLGAARRRSRRTPPTSSSGATPTAPTWTDCANPPARLTTINLPVSKDNVVFGVRSVDAAGHRSPAVLPTPERGQRPATPRPANQ